MPDEKPTDLPPQQSSTAPIIPQANQPLTAQTIEPNQEQNLQNKEEKQNEPNNLLFKLKNRKVIIFSALMLLLILILSTASYFVYKNYAQLPETPNSTNQFSSTQTKQDTSKNILSEIEEPYRWWIGDIASTIDNHFYIASVCNGIQKVDNGEVIDIARPDKLNDSIINKLVWNGEYWLFTTPSTDRCRDLSDREASIQKFDGENYTDLTEAFFSASTCIQNVEQWGDKNDPSYKKLIILSIRSISSNSNKWRLMLELPRDEITNEKNYCFITFDGEKFVDDTEFIKNSITFDNYDSNDLLCSDTLCVFEQNLDSGNNEFRLNKINFEDKVATRVNSDIFKDIPEFSTDYIGTKILASNNQGFIVRIRRSFTNEGSIQASADSIEQYYFYDGEKAKLIYSYTEPLYIESEEEAGENFLSEYTESLKGKFLPEKVIWDHSRKRWLFLGSSVNGLKDEYETIYEFEIHEVSQSYEIGKLSYEPVLIGPGWAIGDAGISKDGLLVLLDNMTFIDFAD